MNKFSIVIPLYNKKKYIYRAINSVLNQTIKDFELIVVNDGSDDGSEKIIERFNDERIRLISQENKGVSAARNTGIIRSKHEFIAFLDADDEWLPDHLETISLLINKFPKAKAYATAGKKSLGNGNYKNLKHTALPAHPWCGELENLFASIACGETPVTASAVCLQKTIFENTSMFPVGIKRSEDLETFIRIFLKFNIAFSTERKVIIHQDHTGGSVKLAGADLGNSYASLELEKKILLNEIPEKMLGDAKKTLSRLVGWEVDANIANQEYRLAFLLLLNKKMKYLPIYRLKLFGKLWLKYLRIL